MAFKKSILKTKRNVKYVKLNNEKVLIFDCDSTKKRDCGNCELHDFFCYTQPGNQAKHLLLKTKF